MPLSLSRFMKVQGWKPIRRAPEGTVCATCEGLLDPEVTNYRRSGMVTTTHAAPYYCCRECAQDLYDEDAHGDEDDL
jgi:hypothetical protein